MPYDRTDAFSGALGRSSTPTSNVDMLRMHTPVNAFLKRAFDIVAASMLIIITLPIMLLVAVFVAAKDGWPVFYGHRRIGHGGESFICWKFRTMVRDSQAQLADLLARDPAARAEWKETQKLRNDPRIIPGIGQFLRKTSLDELPQLWNVLKGEMSMVGPRPVVADELLRYGEASMLYKSVRPGITGPWQVGERSDDDYATRVAKDSAYVRNWTLATDIKIVLLTAGVVVRRKGAY